jgi:UDP-N-acetylmuramyl pentapeptide phosphotransferase/UDP-N-acetylglucosamine-1-phosphate transferase
MKKQKSSPPPFPLMQLVFVAVVTLLPFVFYLKSAEPALTPRYLTIAGLVFVAALYLVIQQHRKKMRLEVSFLRRLIFPALLLYALWGAVSLVNAVNLAEGIFELSKSFLLLA